MTSARTSMRDLVGHSPTEATSQDATRAAPQCRPFDPAHDRAFHKSLTKLSCRRPTRSVYGHVDPLQRTVCPRHVRYKIPFFSRCTGCTVATNILPDATLMSNVPCDVRLALWHGPKTTRAEARTMDNAPTTDGVSKLVQWAQRHCVPPVLPPPRPRRVLARPATRRPAGVTSAQL